MLVDWSLPVKQRSRYVLTPQQRIVSMIVDVVSLVFSHRRIKEGGSRENGDASPVKLLNRVVLLRQLMGQRRRAIVSFECHT